MSEKEVILPHQRKVFTFQIYSYFQSYSRFISFTSTEKRNYSTLCRAKLLLFTFVLDSSLRMRARLPLKCVPDNYIYSDIYLRNILPA